MCGIFSFISNNNSFEIDVNYITNNLNKIKKRGPDNTQTKLINNVFLDFIDYLLMIYQMLVINLWN